MLSENLPVFVVLSVVFSIVVQAAEKNQGKPATPAQIGAPWIYYGIFEKGGNNNGLNRVRLNANNKAGTPEKLNYTFTEANRWIQALSYDCMTGNMYWMDTNGFDGSGGGRIIREDVSRTKAQIVFKQPADWEGDVIAIQVDPIGRKLYWVSNKMDLMAADIDTDTLQPKKVIDGGLFYATELVVHPQLKKVIWHARYNNFDNNFGKLMWSDLEGKNVSVLIEDEEMGWATFVLLKYKEKEVCYQQKEKVVCVNLETKAKKELAKPTIGDRTHEIKYVDGVYYWVESQGNEIIKATSDGSNSVIRPVLTGGVTPLEIAQSGCPF